MKTITRQIRLRGIKPIMFDRYVDMKKQVPIEDKFYTTGEERRLIFPAVNILSFLSADLTESATKRVMGRKWKSMAKAALSFVTIEPDLIPITRNGEKLTVGNCGYIIDKRVARTKKTGGLIVPSEKERPVLPLPWEMEFELTLVENDDLSEEQVKKIFIEGGYAIGLGTFRGLFGKFIVEKWE